MPGGGAGVPGGRHAAWTQAYAEELGLHDAAVYANFVEDDGESRIRAVYPAPTYARLAAVKRRYDPDNVFNANQNIPPEDRPLPAEGASTGNAAVPVAPPQATRIPA